MRDVGRLPPDGLRNPISEQARALRQIMKQAQALVDYMKATNVVDIREVTGWMEDYANGRD